jgi:hypothetical protein
VRKNPIHLLRPQNNGDLMTTDEGKVAHLHHQRGLLIPAGLCIGLGIGLLAGYAAPGLMIGLGLGLIGSALLKHGEYPAGDAAARGMRQGSRWMPALIGLFFIILGISMIWAPQNFWPYIGAGFLILVGIWFIARSFGKA